jgi:hypothetical protein
MRNPENHRFIDSLKSASGQSILQQPTLIGRNGNVCDLFIQLGTIGENERRASRVLDGRWHQKAEDFGLRWQNKNHISDLCADRKSIMAVELPEITEGA